jgi:hypothetical protein
MSKIARRIDLKHHIDTAGRLMKSELAPDGGPTGEGQEIPLEEPTILFRARDKLALPMLKHYRQLCIDAGCTDFQRQQMDTLVMRFTQWAETSSAMKMPGSTQGKL